MSRSKGQERIGRLLKEIFNFPIKEEHYARVGSTKLYFDYYIPHLNLYIEVNGNQHNKRNPFFHKTDSDFYNQILRDKKKEEFVYETGGYLLSLDYKTAMIISKEELMDRILEATEETE